MLQVHAVTKSYATAQGSQQVLRGISLDLQPGQSLALTGESGSGKSTLLHLIAGLDSVDSGTIHIAGQPLTRISDSARASLRRSAIGLVFQQFNLIPSLDVAGNLAFQARLAGRFDAIWLAEIIDRLGLTQLLGHYPEQLSGGQQQRVAIGRAIAGRPWLLLADEPTGNLDQPTGDAVLGLMLELVRRADAALLMVTHSQRLADRLGAEIVLRDGKLA